LTAVRVLAAGLSAGLPLARALEISELGDGPERRVVDSIIEFARATGVPRASALTALADSLDESTRRERAIDIGSATAHQTTRIMLVLPLATAVGAELFGFGVVQVLITTPVGWVCACLGVGLNVLASVWMSRIRAAVPRQPLNAGLALDLAAAVATSSGLTYTHLERIAGLAREWNTETEMDDILRHRAVSRESGIPVAGLLKTEAQLVRYATKNSALHAIELLPGKLLAPVGACLFPAFVLTTVIPVVTSMVGNFVR
jgi:tight adherence protein B